MPPSLSNPTPIAVELIYASDCPNVPLARSNLQQAIERAGVPVECAEHRVDDAALPTHARGYGSPTILVDGEDVAGLPPSGERTCRVYQGPTGLVYAPTVEVVEAALRRAASARAGRQP